MAVPLIIAAVLVFFLGWKGVGIAVLAAVVVVLIVFALLGALVHSVTRPREEERDTYYDNRPKPGDTDHWKNLP